MFEKWSEKLATIEANATLGQRVAFAFAVMVTAVSLFYSVALYYNFKWVELTLSGEHMADQLHAKEQALLQGVAPQVNPGVWLYGDHPWTQPIPEKFKDAPMGFSETPRGDPAFFIYREKKSGFDFMLVKDQNLFEDMEFLFRQLVLIVALLITVAGVMWGAFFFRVVMDPVRKLTRQVLIANEADHYIRPTSPLPMRDDISILAHCCDQALYRLHQALEREQTFSGDVSHEIRNPLNVIQGSLELLGDSKLTDLQRRQVERAQKGALDIKLMVDDFLSFARDARSFGASTADTIPVMFDRMREIWEPEARRRGITFTARNIESCGGVYSMVLLGSVMNNLIRNAVHYTPKGGCVSLEETAEGVSIIDTAGGIPSEEVMRIFTPFYRGKVSILAKERGYGLGLSIVLRVCRRCDWQIRHENVPGGSRFTVLLKPDHERDGDEVLITR